MEWLQEESLCISVHSANFMNSLITGHCLSRLVTLTGAMVKIIFPINKITPHYKIIYLKW